MDLSLFRKHISVLKDKPSNYLIEGIYKPNIPNGIMTKCPECGEITYSKTLLENQKICKICSNHFRISAYDRISMLVDKGSFEEINKELIMNDPISFPGYKEKLSDLQNKTGLNDGVIIGYANIKKNPLMIAAMDPDFMMASMGTIVGEKLTNLFEIATKEKLPVVVFTASGGARMQEGIFSLMQMAKVSAAIARHDEAGLLYITVLTNPTTGGVTASFAMLGDIILSEPKALIGFAGPRVIEQTIGQKLPEGFQRAEFQLKHGFVDAIIPRDKHRKVIGKLISIHKATKHCTDANKVLIHTGKKENSESIYSPWEKVKLARMQERPTSMDYINEIFTDFIEFHGDRSFGDDSAIIGGVAYLGTQPVTVIAIQKGNNTKENIERNFGMPRPEGYRKAMRLMKQAEKFSRPIVCLIDTPGAYPGMDAEERGQGEAIARNLMGMMMLKTQTISIIIGEGGSGGALALGVSDRIYMLEHAVYSILSPEGFASILWKDSSRAEEAAKVMKMTAQDLCELLIVDDVIIEPKGGAHTDVHKMSKTIKKLLVEEIEVLVNIDMEQLIDNRYQKFRKM